MTSAPDLLSISSRKFSVIKEMSIFSNAEEQTSLFSMKIGDALLLLKRKGQMKALVLKNGKPKQANTLMLLRCMLGLQTVFAFLYGKSQRRAENLKWILTLRR